MDYGCRLWTVTMSKFPNLPIKRRQTFQRKMTNKNKHLFEKIKFEYFCELGIGKLKIFQLAVAKSENDELGHTKFVQNILTNWRIKINLDDELKISYSRVSTGVRGEDNHNKLLKLSITKYYIQQISTVVERMRTCNSRPLKFHCTRADYTICLSTSVYNMLQYTIKISHRQLQQRTILIKNISIISYIVRIRENIRDTQFKKGTLPVLCGTSDNPKSSNECTSSFRGIVQSMVTAQVNWIV
ncbi:hypothetical protein AGLY_016800 [Aphis glycines]|uniref:Uncharacterized protein n=1 Tax=Aphis glycines TaxID=307491 RepID=A0A6G0SXF8_APHGL|nr:hypothetical protein AGLY_016800 [Aphis glycines]